MPPRIFHSTGAYRLMDEFIDALELHANAENWYGQNGLDETVMFIPKDFLSTYWTEENIRDLLLSSSGEMTYDTSVISSKYIVVFSILTKMRKSGWISHFVEEQIEDSSLPLRPDSNMFKQGTDHRHMEDLWKGFIDEQWMFCPYTFNRLSNAELSESYILPIQSKECLQGSAIDGDLAILYKVKLHPSCRGSLPAYVVFKEYQRGDHIAAATYDEIAIYKRLKSGSTTAKNIIEYYGSFQMLASGKRTIMLEYANSGDLSTWFQSVEPPSEVEHLTTFWTKFFDLLLGLEAFHNLVLRNSGGGTRYLERIHQVIRPHKILLVRDPSSSHSYDVTFKLVDFGTALDFGTPSSKKQSIDQVHRVQQDNLGDTIYSPPKGINGRLQPESDVWALGALASEALVWSIRGWDGVIEFSNFRRTQTKQGLPYTYHTYFHDGVHRLSTVDEYHREILQDKRVEDRISPLVSQMILEHMLVEHPRVYDVRANPNLKFRRTSRETYSLWQKKFSITFSTESPSIPQLDRSSISKNLMESLRHTAEEIDTQHDPPHFDHDPVTIEKIYKNFITPKDRKSRAGAAFAKFPRSSNNQDDPLKAHPELRVALAKVKNSDGSGRKQMFLIDDSESMSSSQDSIAMTVRVLAYLVKKADVDPDGTIELYFSSQVDMRTESSNSKPLEDAVKGWRFHDPGCDLGLSLESRLQSMLPTENTSSPKPISLYVLTNGLWNDKNPTSLCGVDEAIKKTLRHLDSYNHLGTRWLSIQFIAFFNKRSAADASLGSRRLKLLDDKLEELFEQLDLKLTRRDIFDTREWNDDLKDIILGSVSKAANRHAGERFGHMPPDTLLRNQYQPTRVDQEIRKSLKSVSINPRVPASFPRQESNKGGRLPNSASSPLLLPRSLNFVLGQASDMLDNHSDMNSDKFYKVSSQPSSVFSDSVFSRFVADRVTNFLLEHSEIGSLLGEAVLTTIKNRRDFRSNFERLLQQYGTELLYLAKSGLEGNVAEFIKFRSKQITRVICRHLGRTIGGDTAAAIERNLSEPQNFDMQRPVDPEIGNQLWKSVPDSQLGTGTSVPDVAESASGIKKDINIVTNIDKASGESDTKAEVELATETEDESEDESEVGSDEGMNAQDRDELRSYIRDHTLEVPRFLGNDMPLHNLLQGLRKLLPRREPSAKISEAPEERSIHESDQSSDILAPVAQDCISAFPNLPSLVDKIYHAVMSSHSEPPVPEGMQRVRWICHYCGTFLFDDFEATNPAAIRNLEIELQADNPGRLGRIDKVKHVAAEITYEFGKLISSKTRQALSMFPHSTCQLPIHNDSATQEQGRQAARDKLHLLLCVDIGVLRTELLQPQIQHIDGDRALFDCLRQTYYRNQNPSRWFTLRSVTALHVRRFQLDFSDYTEAHTHEEQCQSSASCICLPPKEKAGRDPGKEYRCEPLPNDPGTIPKSGRLSHYFLCNGSIRHGQKSILKQLPKRTYGELSAFEHEEVLGWGLHFEEGWHWRTIIILVMFFSLSSSAFGIAWSLARGDMGGAFTVSGWWMALGAGFLSYLALRSKT